MHDCFIKLEGKMRQPFAYFTGDVCDIFLEFVKAFIKEINGHVYNKNWMVNWSAVLEGVGIIPLIWSMSMTY